MCKLMYTKFSKQKHSNWLASPPPKTVRRAFPELIAETEISFGC